MKNILKTYGLSKTYGNHNAVKDLNITIPKSSVFAILGPNGSGKSTTLGMLLQSLKPSAGYFEWFDKKPESNDLNYLNEGNKFNGSENDLQLSVTHQCNFRCKFDLAEFPFDAQKCSIDIQMPFEYRNLARDHLTIEPKEVAYLGMLS